MAGASNEEKSIATKGSAHVARSGPPDVCLLPDKKTPIAPPNEVPTTRATTHTSNKTLVAGQPIVQKGDKIGPQSDPAHPGTEKGVTSKTYRQEAVARAGAPTVRTEGGLPARHQDPTTQNRGNTTGTLLDANMKPAAQSQPRKPEERCTVTEVVLLCSHHGRQTTPKDPTLDVLQGDTVTATATRRNLLKAGEPLAECPPAFTGRHVKTKFTITRGDPTKKDNKGPESFVGEDVKVLTPGDWTGDTEQPKLDAKGLTQLDKPAELGSRGTQRTPTTGGITTSGMTRAQPQLGDYKPGGSNRRDYGFQEPARTNNNLDRVNANAYVENRGQPGNRYGSTPGYETQRAVAVADDDRENATARELAQGQFDDRMQRAQRLQQKVAGAVAMQNLVISLNAIREVMTAKPWVITVEAQGCAGAINRTLNVYPWESKSCDLMKLKEVAACFEVFKNVFKVAEQVSDAIGLGRFKFSILDPITCNFTVGWKELERDSTRDTKLTKQRCHLEYGLAVGGSLVDFSVEGRVPVASLVGAAGAAKLANWIRDKFKVGADLLVIIKLGLAVSFVVRYNRYKEITLNEVEVIPSIDVSFGISLQAAKFGVTITAGVALQPTITIRKHDTKIAEIILQRGEGEIYFQAAVQWDAFGWKDEINKKWTIRKLPYGEQKTDVAAWLGA
jgi:hypothetical protein